MIEKFCFTRRELNTLKKRVLLKELDLLDDFNRKNFIDKPYVLLKQYYENRLKEVKK